MGSFHTVVAKVACPRCEDLHYVCHQTKFFDSDYPRFELRVGRGFDPQTTHEELERATAMWDEWARLREGPIDPARCVVFDGWQDCGCGALHALLLSFDLRSRAELDPVSNECGATFVDVVLHPFDDPSLVDRVDFIDWFDVACQWHRGPALDPKAHDAAARRAFVRVALQAHVEGGLDAQDVPWEGVPCADCGRAASRAIGPIFAPLLEVVDTSEGHCAGYYRLRDPEAELLRVASGGMRSGCPCDAGEARLVATFQRREGAWVRTAIERRYVDGLAQLQDVHFVAAPRAIGHPAERSWLEDSLVSATTRLRLR